MSTESRPITILALNDEQKHLMIDGVDSSEKMYNFKFPLTETPAQGWISAFSNLWHQEHQNASARISDRAVVLSCKIDELAHMFPILKNVVASTNEKHAEILRSRAETEATEQRNKDGAKQTAQDALSEALNRLSFS